MPSPPRPITWLLRLLPPEFRAAHREEMEELLATWAEDGQGLRRGWMWVRAGVDIALVGSGLRWAAWRRGRREGTTRMERLARDFGFAVAALRRRPGFALLAVATLTVGIGANTAIFSVVRGVLLRPLPYSAAERIGILWHEFGDGAQNLPAVHALDARDYAERSATFEEVTWATGREWIVGSTDDPEIADVGVVRAGFFEFFGAAPHIGRSFTADDDLPGAARVAILSHRLWVRRFGADPTVVGQSIEVEGFSVEVVGVMPERFRLHLPPEAFLLRDAEIWTPTRLDPARQPPRNFTGYTAFVRLREGATFDQAQEELSLMASGLRAEFPEHAASRLVARVVPLLDDVVKEAETTLLLLFGAVGFVLLIACANVTNLVIVRGHERAHELSLRSALGAGRGDLTRLALAETTLIAGVGSLTGVGLAIGIIEAVRATASASVPRLDGVTIDGTVLGFVLATAAACVVLCGLVPAIQGSRRDPAEALTGAGRSVGSRAQRRLRDALVVTEVAATLVLLVGTGLMVRSFAALGAVDPGYGLDGKLTFRVSLPGDRFPASEDRAALLDDLTREIEELVGSDRVAVVSQLPLTGSGTLQPYAYDEETASNWESVTADQRYVTPGFFDAIGARLLAGRDFDRGDLGGGNSIIIDDLLARRAFGDSDPVGQRLQVNANDAPEHIRYAQVVGVVEHLRLHDLRRPHLTQIWYPQLGPLRFSVIVDAGGDPAALVEPIRRILARLAPGAPMEDVRTMNELAAGSLAPVRLALSLMSGFGLIALLLASVGLYGVLSYTVGQRTREIGVRLALGQAPSQVRSEVVGEGARMVGVALVIGLLAAGAIAHAAAELVYGVAPVDPLTYLSTSALLLAVAMLATWIPARRATHIDPVQALRE